MGVRGLQKQLKASGGQRIDLVEVARNTPVTLLVDFYAFLFYVMNTYSSFSPKETLFLAQNPLRRYELLELNKFEAIVTVIIQLLRLNNIYLEFIGDGAYKVGTDEGYTKHEEWKSRYKIRYETILRIEDAFLTRNVENIYSLYDRSNYIQLLPLVFSEQLRCAISKTNCPLWFADGEADKLLAEIYRQRRRCTAFEIHLPEIFGILSNDSDFALMKECRLVLADTFDSSRDLSFVVDIILSSNKDQISSSCAKLEINQNYPPHQLKNLYVHVFSPLFLASTLKINPRLLPEISILSGNDFTKHFVEKYKSRKFPRPGDIIQAANLLRKRELELKRLPKVEDIPGMYKVLEGDHAFKKAIAFTREFYGYEGSEEMFNKKMKDDGLLNYLEWRIAFEEKNNKKSAFQAERRDATNNDESVENDMNIILNRYCCNGVFPRAALQIIRGRTYWAQPKLEYVHSGSFSIDDSLTDFRIYFYSALGLSSDIPVVEYGRHAKQMFSSIERYPLQLPEDLIWTTVYREAKSNPHAMKEALAKLFTLIFRKTYQKTSVDTSMVNLSILLLIALGSLRGSEESQKPCFLPHELESIVMSMIVCVKRISEVDYIGLSPFDKEMADVFRLAENVITGIILQLKGFGYQESDDPIQFMGNSCQLANIDEGDGLVCGFRSLVVLTWIQALWLTIFDIFTLLYGAATGESATLHLALFLDGNLFRWIYASGALDWSVNGCEGHEDVENSRDCIPINLSTSARHQLRFVSSMRQLFFKEPSVSYLLEYIPRSHQLIFHR